MARREFYSTVDLGGRALVVRSRIGGGFTKVADCRTLATAQRLVDDLNVRIVPVNVVHEAIRLLGLATDDLATSELVSKELALVRVTQAAELLRDAVRPEGCG
jgi:hypothetical protein